MLRLLGLFVCLVSATTSAADPLPRLRVYGMEVQIDDGRVVRPILVLESSVPSMKGYFNLLGSASVVVDEFVVTSRTLEFTVVTKGTASGASSEARFKADIDSVGNLKGTVAFSGGRNGKFVAEPLVPQSSCRP